MNLTPDQLAVLMLDLNPSRVKGRSQGGAQLSYLEAYDVKAMLIRVFGFGGFSAEVINSEIIDIDKREDGKVAVAAMATVRLTIHAKPLLQANGEIVYGDDAVYTETAISGQTGRTVGDVADFAIKTAESDALKRCATYLGTQFGLSLYRNGSTAEVVRKIVAPGQRWPNNLSVQTEPTSEEAQRVLEESLGAVALDEADVPLDGDDIRI